MHKVMGMRHAQRMIRYAKHYSKMVNVLSRHDPEKLPKHVKQDKLEEAYRMLDGYEFVLRKKRMNK